MGLFEGPNKNSSIQSAECFNLVGRRGATTPWIFWKCWSKTQVNRPIGILVCTVWIFTQSQDELPTNHWDPLQSSHGRIRRVQMDIMQGMQGCWSENQHWCEQVPSDSFNQGDLQTREYSYNGICKWSCGCVTHVRIQLPLSQTRTSR